MNIELQVGKRYETRGGEWIAGITGRDEAAAGTDMEFVGYVEFSPGHRSYGRGWCANGRFISGAESASDLIRELPDATEAPEPEPSAEPEPVGDTKAPLRLELGKWYRRQDGGVVRVEYIDKSDDLLPFMAGGVWYSSSGQSVVADEYPGSNLIEEIPAPVAEAAAEMEFDAGEPGESSESPSDPRTTFTAWAVEQPRSDADDAWLRANLADTRANITRKYAQAAAYLLLGIAAIIFAIGTSVQA